MTNNTVISHPTFNRLHAAILATEAAKEAEGEARAETLALIVRDYNSSTVKVEWGQIQVQVMRDYTFRDGGGTAPSQRTSRTVAVPCHASPCFQYQRPDCW